MTELFDAKLIAYSGHDYVQDRQPSTRARYAVVPVAAAVIGGILAFVLFPGRDGDPHVLHHLVHANSGTG